ncbi:MAG TPA: tetratricopeptide repeat protein [Bacteroidales bacterium]|nr:tetratricopeptide repeat protein [Bacteroidales bacterium]
MSVSRFFVFVCFLCVCFYTIPNAHAQKSRRAAVDSVKQELKAIEFERLIIQANLSKNNKEYEYAFDLYQNALSLNSKSALVHYELAGIYKQNYKFQEALKHAQKAVLLNPDLPEYRYFLASLYQDKGEYQKQIEQLQFVIQKQRQNITLYYSIADIYYANADYDKSLQVLSTIEKMFGINEEIRFKRFSIYVLQNNNDKAEESINELIRLYPHKTEYVFIAIQLFEKNKKYTHALDLCNVVPKSENTIGEIQYAKARIFAKIDAIDSITISLIDIFKNTYVTQSQKQEILSTLVLYNLESTQIYTNRYSIIENIYIQVPNDEVLQTVLASYYVRNNNNDKALPLLYKALQIDKTNNYLYNQIIEIETNKKQWDSVISVAKNALIVFPGSAEVYSALGYAYMQSKKYDSAISILQEGLDISYNKKQKRVLYLLLAEALYAQNSVETANQTFEKALALDSTNIYTLSLYAYYAALQGNKEKAQFLLSACLSCELSNEYKLANARLYFEQKNYEQARIIFQSITSPLEHWRYYDLLGDINFVFDSIDDAENAWKKANEFGVTIDIQRKKLFLQKK